WRFESSLRHSNQDKELRRIKSPERTLVANVVRRSWSKVCDGSFRAGYSPYPVAPATRNERFSAADASDEVLKIPRRKIETMRNLGQLSPLPQLCLRPMQFRRRLRNPPARAARLLRDHPRDTVKSGDAFLDVGVLTRLCKE